LSHIRLVASDLDGTLLSPDGAVSLRTLAVIADLRARGIALCLATSRRWTGTRPVAEAIGMDGPLILYDGAITRHYPSGAVLDLDALPANTASAAAELLFAHGLRPIVQYGDGADEILVTTEAPSAVDAAAVYLAQYAPQVRVAPLDQLTGAGAPVLRVVAFGALSRLREVARQLSALPCGRQLLNVGAWTSAELTLFSATASKGAALASLAARHDIPMSAVLAIGDGVNDRSMLRVAGASVAMGNAPRAVQRAARYVAPPCAEDGFAVAVEQRVLADGQARDGQAIPQEEVTATARQKHASE
jgi:Cof subfamily protein (haloacid dehalogenase superfamily)